MKIAIYVRVSTAEQAIEGYSIPAQISMLRQYCISFQYDIYKIYQDQGISGKNIKDRPGLLNLIEDAKEHKFNSVIVWKLSRLSRSLLDLLSVVDMFDKHNISFQSYSEKFDTSTAMGKMLLHMLGSIAEFERNTIVENVKMGMEERFKSGLSKGSIPFGYVYNNKEVLTVQDQAEAVKFAFEYYNSTNSKSPIMDIVEYFNSNQILTLRSNKWIRQTIREMLKNKFYAGYVRTGIGSHQNKKELYKESIGNHEAIISIDLYESVNKKIDSLKNNNIRNYKNECVLTGLIKCPYCNGKMFGTQALQYYVNKDGIKKTYAKKFYRCITASNKRNECKGFTISAKKIEPKVIELLLNIDTKHLRLAINQAKKESKKTDTPYIDKVKVIEKELSDARKIRESYYKVIESGNLDHIEQFTEKLNNIMNKINMLEIKKEEKIKDKIDNECNIDISSYIDSIKKFNTFYNEASNEEKKVWLRSLIKEIEIGEDKKIKSIKTIQGINLV